MTILSCMARMTVRSTFSLDPETVAELDRLAERWGASKSETLRRVVAAAARVEQLDQAGDALAALEELQDGLGLTATQADAWVREVRAEREAAGP